MFKINYNDIIVIYSKVKGADWIDIVTNNVPFQFLLGIIGAVILTSVIRFLLIYCSNFCWRITYLILIIIIILEIVVIAHAFLYKDKFFDMIAENCDYEEYAEIVFSIEKEFQCCGFNISYKIGDKFG